MGAIAISEALQVNAAVTNLNLGLNDIGPEGGKVIGQAIVVNTAVRILELQGNMLDAATKYKLCKVAAARYSLAIYI